MKSFVLYINKVRTFQDYHIAEWGKFLSHSSRVLFKPLSMKFD